MRIVIAGGGTTGRELALQLAAAHDVVVLEKEKERADELQSVVDGKIIAGDVMTRTGLERCGLPRAALYIAACGNNEINLLSCLGAKAAGANKTAAVIKNSDYRYMARYLAPCLEAVDLLIDTDAFTAALAAELADDPCLAGKAVFKPKGIVLSGFILAKNSPLTGREIAALQKETGGVVCALVRQERTLKPHGRLVLQEGDVVYVLDNMGSLTQRQATGGKRRFDRRRILIWHGGVTGRRIASVLSAEMSFSNCLLFDPDESRCVRAAAELPAVRILQGDLSDAAFFASLAPGREDVLLATGPDDRENLLVALTAKSCGLENIVIVVREKKYGTAFRAAGLYRLVSPQEKILAAVLDLLYQPFCRFFFPGGGLAAAAIRVTESFKFAWQSMDGRELPDQAYPGAVVRSGKILPGTQPALMSGDILLLVLPDGLGEKLLPLLAAGEERK